MQSIWTWIQFLLPLMTTQPLEPLLLTLGQGLVGTPLADDVSVLIKWWATLRVAVIWYIWIARIEETRQNKRVSSISTKSKIW